MPRQSINIENFHRGIISKVDSGDIPNESCPYSLNINPLFTEGKLLPLKDKTQISTLSIFPPKITAFIDRTDSTKSLIYWDGFKLRAIDDFHTTRTVTMTIASPCVVTLASHGLITGTSIIFYTSGTLPTGINYITHSFVRVINANTFHVYDTKAHALDTGSTTGRVTSTGTQSGVHGIVLSYNFDNLNAKSLTPYNSFVNIGCGDDDPKWAGYVASKQFDALLTKPSADSGSINQATLTGAGSGYTNGYAYANIVQTGGSGGKILVFIAANAVSFLAGSIVGGAGYIDGSATLSGGGGTNATVNLTINKLGNRAGEIAVDNSKTVNTGDDIVLSVQIVEPVTVPTTVCTSVADSGGFFSINDTVGTPFASVIDGTSKMYLSNFYYETYDADRGTYSSGVLDGEYLITSSPSSTNVVINAEYPSLGTYESITFMSLPSYKLITYRSQFQYKEAGGAYSTPEDIYENVEYTLTTAQVSDLVIKFLSDHGYVEDDIYTITIKGDPDNELVYEDAELKNYRKDATVSVDMSNAWTAPGTAFSYTKKYYYGWSFIYDDSQESPVAWKEETAFVTKEDGAEKNEVEITINNPASLSARITAINIWRAEGISSGKEPETQFRLVKNISLNDGWKYISATSNSIKVLDVDALQATYEAATGIPQELDSNIVRYSYSTLVNGKLIMVKCYTDFWEDSLRMVFASKPNKLNTVDVANDLCKLKFIPVGVAAYNGKVLVFGDSQYAIVNPEGMYIEQESVGIGAYSHKSITVTDWGIYWCDARGAYYYDGARTTIISDAISDKVESGLVEWADLFGSNKELVVVYYHKLRCVIFADTYNGKAFAYYLVNKSWFYWTLYTQSSSTSTLFVDKDNVLYLGTGVGWYTLFTAATYLAWAWYSKKFNGDDPGEDKKWYMASVDGNATVNFGINGGTLTQTLSSGLIAEAYRRAKIIQFKLSGTASGTLYYANNLRIIVRTLGSKRQ